MLGTLARYAGRCTLLHCSFTSLPKAIRFGTIKLSLPCRFSKRTRLLELSRRLDKGSWKRLLISSGRMLSMKDEINGLAVPTTARRSTRLASFRFNNRPPLVICSTNILQPLSKMMR